MAGIISVNCWRIISGRFVNWIDMAKLRKNLNEFALSLDERPLVLSPDLVNLFHDLGYTRYLSLLCALVVQRVAHMQVKVKPKHLSLNAEELELMFSFTDPRMLRKCLHVLRKVGVWKNTKYVQGRKSYVNIRIDWKAVARLAKQVKK